MWHCVTLVCVSHQGQVLVYSEAKRGETAAYSRTHGRQHQLALVGVCIGPGRRRRGPGRGGLVVGPDDKVVLSASVITIRARPINTAHFTADGGLACRPDVWPPRPPGAARAGRGGQVLLIATRLLLVTTHRLMTRAPRPPVPTERRPPPPTYWPLRYGQGQTMVSVLL